MLLLWVNVQLSFVYRIGADTLLLFNNKKKRDHIKERHTIPKCYLCTFATNIMILQWFFLLHKEWEKITIKWVKTLKSKLCLILLITQDSKELTFFFIYSILHFFPWLKINRVTASYEKSNLKLVFPVSFVLWILVEKSKIILKFHPILNILKTTIFRFLTFWKIE